MSVRALSTPVAGMAGNPGQVRAATLEMLIARLVVEQATGQIGYWAAVDDEPRRAHLEEDKPGVAWQPAAAPVVQLGEDEGQDGQVLVRVREQPGTALVIGIGGIERGKQRAGVAEQRTVSAAPRRQAQP